MALTPLQRKQLEFQRTLREENMAKFNAKSGAMSASGIDLKLPTVAKPEAAASATQTSPPAKAQTGYKEGEVPRATTTASGIAADLEQTELEKAQITDYDELGRANIQAEYDKLGEYGADLGLGPDDIHKSLDEQLKASIQRQRERKAAEEAKLLAAKNKTEYEAKKSTEALRSGAEVGKGQLTPDREGFVSGSNIMASSKFTAAIEEQSNRIQIEKNQVLDQIDAAQKELDFAMKAGNTETIKQYSDILASAKQRAQLLDTQIIDNTIKAQTQSLEFLKQIQDTGILVGASDETIQNLSDTYGVDYSVLKTAANLAVKDRGTKEAQLKFDNQTKALSTFQSLVTSGIKIPFNIFEAFAESTGLSSGDLMKFNETAQAILADKTLGVDKQRVLIAQEFEKLSQMQKGVYTAAAQDIEFLKRLYKEGASPEVISAFKSRSGITDYDDPITQAKLAYDMAEARIKTNNANGVYNSPQDMLTLANAKAVLAENGLLPDAYIATDPRNDKYKVVVNPEGGVDIEGAVIGAIGGQCGTFVNDVLGTAVSDSVESKLKYTDPTLTVPTAGDLFVQTFPASADPNQYGHTGIVKFVDHENMRFKAIESNYHKDETVSERWVSFSEVAGFGHPPKARAHSAGGPDDKKTFEDFLNDPVTKGMTQKEKRAYAQDQVDKQSKSDVGEVNYAGFEEEKNRLDRANAGESKQVRDGNIEAFNNAVKTGDPENVKMTIDEIERKKYLARTEPIQNDFDTNTKDYNTVKDKVTQMQAIYDYYKGNPQQSRTFIDQAIITLYNKILDPSSVVREAEYQRTPEDVAALNRIYGYMDKINRGGSGISDDDIKNAVEAAQHILIGATERYTYEQKRAKQRAKVAGVPEDFLMDTLGIEREKYGPETPASLRKGYSIPSESTNQPANGYINYDQI